MLQLWIPAWSCACSSKFKVWNISVWSSVPFYAFLLFRSDLYVWSSCSCFQRSDVLWLVLLNNIVNCRKALLLSMNYFATISSAHQQPSWILENLIFLFTLQWDSMCRLWWIQVAYELLHSTSLLFIEPHGSGELTKAMDDGNPLWSFFRNTYMWLIAVIWFTFCLPDLCNIHAQMVSGLGQDSHDSKQHTCFQIAKDVITASRSVPIGFRLLKIVLKHTQSSLICLLPCVILLWCGNYVVTLLNRTPISEW